MTKAINQITLFAFLVSTFWFIYEIDEGAVAKNLKQFGSINGEARRSFDEDESSYENNYEYNTNNGISYDVDYSQKDEEITIFSTNEKSNSNDIIENKDIVSDSYLAISNISNDVSNNVGGFTQIELAVSANVVEQDYGNVAQSNEGQPNSSSGNINYATKENYNEAFTGKGGGIVDVAASLNNLAAKPPPPGNGGADPYNVPLDDYYGIILLIFSAAIIGVWRIRKV
jgi:hypothetical protein